MRPDDRRDGVGPARRRLLALGGSALAASLAGCTSALPFGGGRPEVRDASGGSPDRSVPSAIPGLSAESTVAALAVGRGTNHHQVWVWNASGRSREVSLGIGGEDDGEPWFRESYALDTDANLVVDLRESRRYAITVQAGEQSETVEISESRFDCNASATDVAIRADGIESRSISTSMACDSGLL